MAQINAYLGFNGACREAMNFYKDCLGGELAFTTVGESPMAGQCPEAMHGNILHSELKKGDLILMGTDMVPRAAISREMILALRYPATAKKI